MKHSALPQGVICLVRLPMQKGRALSSDLWSALPSPGGL